MRTLASQAHGARFASVVLVVALTVLPALAAEQKADSLPAFPGAEGFGAKSVGGRGGRVIKVTNLNSDGLGSLQWACKQKGPRIVVFDVSGVIKAPKKGEMRRILIHDSNITIAGQTAPGAGISVEGKLAVTSKAGRDAFEDESKRVHDVIVRFLRFRPPQYSNYVTGGRAFEFCYVDRGIADHISASWGTDEEMLIYSSSDITFQWCTVEESEESSQAFTLHNFGMVIGYGYKDKGDITMHHSLFSHHARRSPLIGLEIFDHRNNVMYNLAGAVLWHPERKNKTRPGKKFRTNLVANYFKEGPAGALRGNGSQYAPDTAAFPSIQHRRADLYSEGNYFNWRNGHFDVSKVNAPAAWPAAPVTTHCAERAYELVMAHSGCLPRDVVSRRQIEETRKGTGSWGRVFPENGLMAGLKPGKASKDSDNDGMPDEWEKAHKLNPDDPKDASTVVPAGASAGDRHKGYTYIEFYINDLADRLIAEAIAESRDRDIHVLPSPIPDPLIAAAPAGKAPKHSAKELLNVIKEGERMKSFKAAISLASCGDASGETVATLIELLQSEKPLVRWRAALALGRIGPKASASVDVLAKNLESQDDSTRWFAAWALGRMGPDAGKAVDALGKALLSDTRTAARAAWAILQIGPNDAEKAIPQLLKALGNREGGVSWNAAKALARIGKPAVPHLIRTLSGKSSGAAANAAFALGMMTGGQGVPAVPALSKNLSSKDPAVRRASARTLGSLGPEAKDAVDPLARCLKDEVVDVRKLAAQSLGKIGPGAASATTALAAALSDKESLVRAAAAAALGRIGEGAEAAVPALSKLLLEGADPWSRYNAATGLSGIGVEAKSAESALIKALSDRDSEVRAEAAWALGSIGPGAKAVASLKKALSDSDPVVRLAATDTLKKIAQAK